MPAIVQVRDLHKSFTRGSETIDVLQGLTLDVAAGEFLALMGPSGSGKTTLLNLIAGLDRPTEGVITFDGIDVILDARDLRAGPKFADADLIGFPLRVTLGPRTVEQGMAELKLRTAEQIETVPLSNIPGRVAQMLMDS